MKVLALASTFRLDGKGIAAHYIADNLAIRNNDVFLQIFDSIKDLEGHFKAPSYKVDYRPSVALMPSTGLHVLKQVLYLLRLQRSKDFDVALCLDAADTAVMGAAFAKEAGVLVGCMAWGNELDALGRAELGFLRNCDMIFPMGRWARERFIGAGFDEDKMKMILPGVDPKSFAPGIERGNRLGIVTVTELVRGCGVDQLLEVLRLLLERGTDAFLTVVGAGPLLKGLKAKAKEMLLEDSVAFVGRSPHDRMAALFDRHHVFALIPRRTKGSLHRDISLAMLEARACGLGVVGTGLDGIADSLYMCDGKEVPAQNTERIADAIESRVPGSPMSDPLVHTTSRGRTWEDVAFELETELAELVYE